ncbi:UDP-2,4-diacetamido-2,4, 6-trideoxy-beta-L-altropyranose hydrolase [Azospirillaceae bacterium]
MRTIIIRADADPFMGTGHVMRCLAVAEALIDTGVQCHFITVSLPTALEERLRTAGMVVHRLDLTPSAAGGFDDLTAVRALATALNAEGAIVDGYQFESSWRAGLATEKRLTILAFDDLATLPNLYADIVVNPSPAAKTLPYDRIAPNAQLLLGPAYAPLRREIRNAKAAPSLPFEQRRALLLTFGGSDPLALTTPCLKRLVMILSTEERLIVAIGPSNPHKDEIIQVAAAFGNRVETHFNCADMGSLMNRAGLAISAGGGTVGELAALGVPTLLVVVADNQAPAAGPATATGWCRSIDARGADVCDRIVETTTILWQNLAIRKAMSENARTLVDAQGALRIARALSP